MKIVIEATPKEIADFVLGLQNQPETIEKKIIDDLNEAISSAL